jgi:hypothetical protein
MERIKTIPERLIGVGIEVAVPVEVKLTEVCPARAATSLGGDEGVQVAGGDANVPADLDERNAPLGHEPAHEP